MVVSFLGMQRRLMRTKIHSMFLYSMFYTFCVSKETTHEPSKVASAKEFSTSVYVIDKNLFRWTFFIPYDNWKTLYFVKDCCYFEIFSTCIMVLSLKQLFWKSPYFMLPLQKECGANIKIFRLKIKLSYTLHRKNLSKSMSGKDMGITIYFPWIGKKYTPYNGKSMEISFPYLGIVKVFKFDTFLFKAHSMRIY